MLGVPKNSGRAAVKRTVFLICALFLLLDLADDGHLGKAKFVPPDSPVNSLKTSSEYAKSSKGDSQTDLLPANFLPPLHQSPHQPATPVIRTIHKIIVCCLLSSAGGLPW